MENQTQTKTAPASSADSSSSSANSNAVSDSLQTSNTAQIEGGSNEGNSDSSDGKNGAASDGDRQRPGRAERRISELTKRNKEVETQLEEKNSLLERLSKTPVDPNSIQ